MTIGRAGNFLRSFPALSTLPSSSNIFVFIASVKFPGICGVRLLDNPEYTQFCMTSTGSRHWFSLLLIPSEKIFHNERFDSLSTFPVCLLDPFLSSTTAAFMNQTF